jgi:transposase
MKQTFEKIPRSLIALETGTHSPWVSRLLTELGHEALVAHAQRVQLISKSTRKDDRHDPRTLSRLARIDPELLAPVHHRSARAQIHLTVIRARAELVSARTALVNAARGLVKSYGQRLPKCGTQQVSRELAAELSVELREVLEPAAQRNRIAERAHPGIRRPDGENRPGELPAGRAAQTGEGGRDADRADVCPDHRRSTAVPEES